MSDKKCKDKVKGAFKRRMKDIKTLWEAEGQETEELGSLYNYGLSIDKVKAGTWEGQRENYICYQLSWGGPSEDFRVYENGDVEFWYLDWGDGAKIDVTGENADIIKDITSMVIE